MAGGPAPMAVSLQAEQQASELENSFSCTYSWETTTVIAITMNA